MKNLINVRTSTLYPEPPGFLYDARFKWLNTISRPHSKNMQDKCRDGKNQAYVEARNRFMQYACLWNSVYYGLSGTKFDEIALVLYPVIRKMVCVEIDKDICNEMQMATNKWNEICKSFKVSYVNKEILYDSPDPCARIYDFDFTRFMNEEVAIQLIKTIFSIPQSIFGVMIFNPYGIIKEATKETNEGWLNEIISKLKNSFNILDEFRTTYRDSQMPIMHQTLILERKNNHD